MEFLKKNVAVAAVALVLVCVLAFPLGTLRSVKSVKSDVSDAFNEKDRFGETVKNTVDSYILHLTQFCSEYEKAVGEDGDLKELKLFVESIDGFTVSSDAQSAERIMKTVTSMKDRLSAALLLTDEANRAFASIDSDMAILKRYEAYNEAASGYNEIASSFVGAIFGLDRAIQFN